MLHHGVSASVRLEGLAVLKLAVKAPRSSGKGIFWLFRRRVRSAEARAKAFITGFGRTVFGPETAPFLGRFWVV